MWLVLHCTNIRQCRVIEVQRPLHRWIMGKMCLSLCSYGVIFTTAMYKSTVTQKQMNTVQTHAAQCVSCSVLICVLLASLTVQKRRKNTRILKISCCISHIKPPRPLALFLFLLHYVTSDPLLWQTRLRSPHIWTSTI